MKCDYSLVSILFRAFLWIFRCCYTRMSYSFENKFEKINAHREICTITNVWSAGSSPLNLINFGTLFPKRPQFLAPFPTHFQLRLGSVERETVSPRRERVVPVRYGDRAIRIVTQAIALPHQFEKCPLDIERAPDSELWNLLIFAPKIVKPKQDSLSEPIENNSNWICTKPILNVPFCCGL